jgi:hypothetical protein
MKERDDHDHHDGGAAVKSMSISIKVILNIKNATN